ncbi:hypothetical protein CHARACLAT_013867 [Characodon lateralis]|uniref:Uncharacterized protein n=1 Tax=Characodon lateralis TaxID=208331 RepID=A0ABU7E1Z2_9TELE|nr:hypothetical protein [Characodon lateralis]
MMLSPPCFTVGTVFSVKHSSHFEAKYLSLSLLTIQVFSRRHLASPFGQLQVSAETDGFSFGPGVFFLASRKLNCKRQHWCPSIFQFIIGLRLGSSWTVLECCDGLRTFTIQKATFALAPTKYTFSRAAKPA